MTNNEVTPADIIASIGGCSGLETKIKGLIKEHVYPLVELSRRYVEILGDDDESSYYVKKLGLLAEEVVKKVELELEESKDYANTFNDLVELGKTILEHTVNLFPGAGKYGDITFLVYSLRTLPYLYARSLYPPLHDDNELHRCIHELLGWCTVLPLKKTPEYSLMGYPDYPRHLKYIRRLKDKDVFEYEVVFSSCLGQCPKGDEKYNNEQSRYILGGSLSRLINTAIAVLTMPGYLKTYSINPDLISEYINHFREKGFYPYSISYSNWSVPYSYYEEKKPVERYFGYVSSNRWRVRKDMLWCLDVGCKFMFIDRKVVMILLGYTSRIVEFKHYELCNVDVSPDKEKSFIRDLINWSPVLAYGLADIMFGDYPRCKYPFYIWLLWGSL